MSLKPLILAVLLFGQHSLADTLRDYATSIPEATPHMGIFSDYQWVDSPGMDWEEWADWEKETVRSLLKLESALKSTKNPIEKQEIQFALAQGYLQREVYLRRLSEFEYLQKWDLYQRNKLDHEPELSYANSQKQIFKAVNHLRSLVALSKGNSASDVYIYELARNLCRIRNDNAKFYFEQFDKRFPRSPLKPKIELAKADCLFDAKDYQKAAPLYLSVTKTKDQALRAYALYKLGWSYLSQAQTTGGAQQIAFYPRAEQAFQLAYKKRADDDSERLFPIASNSLKDLTWIYAKRGKTQEALSYFNSIGKKEWLPYVFYHSGFLNERAGNQAVTMEANIYLANKFKEFRFLPEVYLNLIRLYQTKDMNLANLKRFNQLIGNMVKDLTEGGDWHDAYEDRESLVTNVEAIVEYNTRIAALNLHEKSSQIEAFPKEALIEIAQIYETYLEYFIETEDAYDLYFNLATIQFQAGQFKKAIQSFQTVYDWDEPKTEHRRDALYNKILALRNIDEQSKKPKLPELGAAKEPIELTEEREDMLEAMAEFCEEYLKDESVPAMHFTMAQAYLEFGHYEEAVQHFETLSRMQPGEELGRNAMQTILSLYGSRGNWQEVKDKTLEYLDDPKLVQPKMQKLLTDALNQAEDELDKQTAQSKSEKE